MGWTINASRDGPYFTVWGSVRVGDSIRKKMSVVSCARSLGENVEELWEE